MGTDNKRIFILGCSTMQIPAFRIAREMGWYIVAADGNSKAEGISMADEFFHVDLKDSNGLIETASRIAETGGLDGVFTAGTDFSLSVALIADFLDLPGHSPEAARLATDKVAMRRRFSEMGVPSPAFSEVGPDDNSSAAAEGIPGPWVVKPVDSMGARGVIRIDRTEHLSAALAEARTFSRSGRALLESYMEGPEFSLDALVEDGKILCCGLADRHIFYPPHFIEVGHTIPSNCSNSVSEDIWRVFEAGVNALGLSCGAAKGDVKLTPQGPMIGEIAARLSGGYMSGWTWPAASGVEPTRGALRLAVGLDAALPFPPRNLVCAERALISIDGTLRCLDGDKKARGLPGLKEVFLRYTAGDTVSFPRNNVEKAGNVIAVGQNEAEASDRALAALRALNLELDPSDTRTGVYLDGTSLFPPDALEIESDYLIELWRRFPPTPSRGCPVRKPLIRDLKLPGQDLAGRTATDILTKLSDEGLLEVADPANHDRGDHRVPDTQILSDFWKALIRGGLAGARWYLEHR